MTPMILTEEQSRLIAQVGKPVDVVDAQGRLVGVLSPLSPADLEAIAQVNKVAQLAKHAFLPRRCKLTCAA